MRRLSWLLGLVVMLGLGCDSAESVSPVAGTVTFGAEEGADFLRGVANDPGNYLNSDLYATRNGDHLRLATGGANPTVNRPVTWFKPAGVPRRFDSLAEVPNERPPEGQPDPLLSTQTGHGFVLQRKDGGYTKGWIEAADADEVTIQFEPLQESSD